MLSLTLNIMVWQRVTKDPAIWTVFLFSKFIFNPRSLLEKIVIRSLEGGRGQSDPPPFYFRHSSSDWLEIWHIQQASFLLLIKRNHVVSNWFPRQQESNKWRHRRPPSCIFKFSDFVHIFTFVPQIDGKTAFSGWNPRNRSNPLWSCKHLVSF